MSLDSVLGGLGSVFYVCVSVWPRGIREKMYVCGQKGYKGKYVKKCMKWR